MDSIILLYEKRIKELVEKMRPEVEIRSQLDIGYKYEKGALELFESRPNWMNKSDIMHHSFAKAKFSKSSNIWKIYWKRASGKWELYKPFPEVVNIDEFFELVNEDKHHVFFG
jgi:hypothetical protein